MTKTLLFVTGTRADFGKIEPLAIKARDAGYSVVSGSQECICWINMGSLS